MAIVGPRYLRALAQRPLALVSHAVLVLAILAAACASVYPVDPLKQDLMGSLAPPTLKGTHAPGGQSALPAFMGTDSLGRDLASRTLVAIRVSLAVSFLAVVIAATFFIALFILVFSMVLDVAYGLIDPRVRVWR